MRGNHPFCKVRQVFVYVSEVTPFTYTAEEVFSLSPTYTSTRDNGDEDDDDGDKKGTSNRK